MKIDGKRIAQDVLNNLKHKIDRLKTKGINPNLYIITLTTDSASKAYVSQKKIKGSEIGVKITVENLNPNITTAKLLEKIGKINKSQSVHGIIVQRPLPSQIDERKVAESINPQKDIDGFHSNSKFIPPIGLAVLKILENIYASTRGVEPQISNWLMSHDITLNKMDGKRDFLNKATKTKARSSDFIFWLRNKKICIIGKGITAGYPIIKTLQKLGIQPQIISRKTLDKKIISKSSDIIISAVGKPNVIRKDDLKKGVILIGVGMIKDKNGKFKGDYDEDKIEDIADFYTPTPGGVGPVNVAMLLSNLVKAAEALN